jgi:VWFA-related protein
MPRVRVAILLGLIAAGAAASGQQQPPAPARATGTVQGQATAIVVDVIVRDRRGQPVTDLTAADFELLEDGERQDIGSVQLYTQPDGSRSVAAAPAGVPLPATAAATAAGKPTPQPAPAPVIAMVFDRLTPEARQLAQNAALGYVGKQGETDAVIGVFSIDLSLTTYQGYTRDASLLRKAVDRIGSRSSAVFESQAGVARDAARRAQAAENTMAAGGGPGGAPAGAGGAAPDALFAAMEQRTAETWEMLERDQQGYSTSNSLLAVVNGMRALPGRKSVVFFSEGVAIPANVAAQFRSVIDTANRANVSIYAMDAAGLRAHSTSEETKEGINAAAQKTLRRNPAIDVVGRPMTEALEKNEDLLRHDPHSGLGQLADQTGGILIRNTNDLAGGFKRVDQDMRNYYMLTYVPKNDRFDGKFRTIAVTVKRSGMDVAARKGYYAVRTAGTMPVLTFEARALAVLESSPVPNAFPVRATAIRFPEPNRPGLTPVLVTVPLSALTFALADDKTTYRADFTVLVRFRDQSDAIVGKLSQNYALNGPADRMDAARQGNILFYRDHELEPGVYTMETVVHDALGDKASVRFSTVEQSAIEEGALRASQLVIVGRAERLAEGGRPAGNPFLVGDTLLYPNFGEPLRKSADQQLPFFVTVYPLKGSKAEGIVELAQGAKLLAQLPLPMIEPDAAGRIQQVSRLPLATIPAGTYELRVIVSQGKQRLVRSAMVRIVD